MKKIEMEIKTPADLMALMMGGGRTNSKIAQSVIVPLRSFCDVIKKRSRELESLSDRLSNPFADTNYVLSAIEDTPNNSLGMFSTLPQEISKAIQRPVDHYLGIESAFRLEVGDKADFKSGAESFDEVLRSHGEGDAASAVRDLATESLITYGETRANLPSVVKFTKQTFVKYDSYLRTKFIKSEDEKKMKRR